MRHLLYKIEPKYIRDKLNLAIAKAKILHKQEKELIEILKEIDQRRLFVRYGFRSLRTFCERSLGYSRIQSQSLIIKVRHIQPEVDIRQIPEAGPNSNQPDSVWVDHRTKEARRGSPSRAVISGKSSVKP